MIVIFHIGDCREVLRTLPDKSMHCCVTLPPYFGLRDYAAPANYEHNAFLEQRA